MKNKIEKLYYDENKKALMFQTSINGKTHIGILKKENIENRLGDIYTKESLLKMAEIFNKDKEDALKQEQQNV